jgi:hypothetical protein
MRKFSLVIGLRDVPFFEAFEPSSKEPLPQMTLVPVSNPDIPFSEYQNYLAQNQLPVTSKFASCKGPARKRYLDHFAATSLGCDINLAALFYQPDFDPTECKADFGVLLIQLLGGLRLRTLNVFFKRFALRLEDKNNLVRISALIMTIFRYSLIASESLKPEYDAVFTSLFRAHRDKFQAHRLDFLWQLFLHAPELMNQFVTEGLGTPEDTSLLSYNLICFVFTTADPTPATVEKFEKYMLPLPLLDLNCHDNTQCQVPLFWDLLKHTYGPLTEDFTLERKNFCRRLLEIIATDPRFKFHIDLSKMSCKSRPSSQLSNVSALTLAREMKDPELAQVLAKHPMAKASEQRALRVCIIETAIVLIMILWFLVLLLKIAASMS